MNEIEKAHNLNGHEDEVNTIVNYMTSPSEIVTLLIAGFKTKITDETLENVPFTKEDLEKDIASGALTNKTGRLEINHKITALIIAEALKTKDDYAEYAEMMQKEAYHD